MLSLVVSLIAVGVVALAAAVTYHASHAAELWPLTHQRRRLAAPPATNAPDSPELADYVRRGLDDVTLMLKDAARQHPQ